MGPSSWRRPEWNDYLSWKIYFIFSQTLPLSGGNFPLNIDAHSVQVGNFFYKGSSKRQTIDQLLVAVTKKDGACRRYKPMRAQCYHLGCTLTKVYPETTPQTIWTNHSLLWWKLNLADAYETPVVWLLHQSKFDFDVLHCADVKHQEATAFPWIVTIATYNKPLKNEIHVQIIQREDNVTETFTIILAFDTHKLPLFTLLPLLMEKMLHQQH